MRLRPALVLAAPAGVLGGHAIGHLAAPGSTGVAAPHHGYLALVLALVVPLAVLAVAWAAARGSVGVAPRNPSLGPLLVAQWALFTGQEVVEHALAGHGAAAVIHSPALWCGLAAQVLTAVVVVVVLRASAATGARLAAVAAWRPSLTLPVLCWFSAYLSGPASSSEAATVSPSRGPPVVRIA